MSRPFGYVQPTRTVICRRCERPHIAKRRDAICGDCSSSAIAARLAAWRTNNPDKVKANKRNFQNARRAHRAFYQMTRLANQRQATPPWADLDAIKGMYELCGIFRRIGLDLNVDHIIPFKGKTVCGLHVENNLQLLTRFENMSKKNRLLAKHSVQG